METERPDAIFRDPFARRLAGDRGQAIVEHIKRGRQMAWAMIVRTAVFDEIILDAVQRRGVDTVVNLAAGLDARPWRMQLPSSLRWFDIDLPDILQYKSEMLRDERPVCHYEALPTDLTDATARDVLFARLGAAAQSALIVTEGLLVYLDPEQVAALAQDLHAHPTLRWWLFDLASPRLLRWIQRDWGKSLASGNAPMKFAPAEGTGFFRPFGWREAEFRPTGEDAQRLHRQMKGAWIWRISTLFMPEAMRKEYQRMSAQVLLERQEP
jgi:methyltransferase (TIGR00027 family)